MTTDEYQNAVDRTANKALNAKDSLLNGALGLNGEAGEVAELVKKICFHERDLDTYRFKDEMGDVMWYMGYICNTMGFSLEEIMEQNVKKLQERWPDGFKAGVK